MLRGLIRRKRESGDRMGGSLPGAGPGAARADRGPAAGLTGVLRRLAEEGIDSGPGLDADAVFARLRTRFRPPPAA